MEYAVDQEAAMRQRYLEIDEKTAACRESIEGTEWTYDSFRELYDISWIYHENGLEGVVLTYPEIKSAVDNKIISDVSLLPTYRAVKTQKWCIDQMRDKSKNKRAVITVQFLKELHTQLCGEDPEDAAEYRKDIPIHRTYFHEIEHPQKIQQALVKALDYLKARHDELHPIELASNAHHRFMRVFPFSKHTGIIGRLLLNFVLERAGYLPVVIHASDRQRYYEALRGAERDFRDFVAEAMENSLENAVKFFAGQERTRRGA